MATSANQGNIYPGTYNRIQSIFVLILLLVYVNRRLIAQNRRSLLRTISCLRSFNDLHKMIHKSQQFCQIIFIIYWLLMTWSFFLSRIDILLRKLYAMNHTDRNSCFAFRWTERSRSVTSRHVSVVFVKGKLVRRFNGFFQNTFYSQNR